jgi:hypothetical protein
LGALLFQAHVELVFSNAITYNGWECFIGGLVEDLQNYCHKFLLDAANVSSEGHKTSSTMKTRGAVGRSPTKTGRQRSGRKPAAAISEDDEEESWFSSTSESEEDEDEEEEEEDFSSDSDFGGAGRKRQLRRRPAPKSKKKAKRRR